MKQASWNDYLSINNPWTKRLLGLEPFSKIRNLEQIEAEYNQDKYARLLPFDFADVEHYRSQENQLDEFDEQAEVFVSFQEELFTVQLSLLAAINRSLIFDTVKKYQPSHLCELGCGYGYNLSYLKSLSDKVWGGEYSENAVTIGKRSGLDVRTFNYYNLHDYELILGGCDRTVVLTVHSVEQLPSAQCFLDGISTQKDLVDLVIQFEPSLLPERASLIGMLRNRYIELNDYNRDLLEILRNRDDVEILEYQPDLIGFNPLNPTNLIVWRFKPSLH